MRVSHAGGGEEAASRRRSRCMEAAFRGGGNDGYCGSGGGRGGKPKKMRDGGMGCGSGSSSSSYSSLIRHDSAVFEHDFGTNWSSLVRTVSEVREEMQLGLPSDRRGGSSSSSQQDGGYVSDGKVRSGGLVRQVAHEFSHECSSPRKKGQGQINSFVYKNYALHDRRTLSLPVGTEYSIREYATEFQTRLDRDSSSGNVTYSERHTSVSSSSGGGDSDSTTTMDGCRIQDFDFEAERHSKSTLFFQAGSTLLTVMVAMFTLYLCIRFLTSGGHHHGEDPRSDNTSQCRLFSEACPLLGLLTAGLAVVLGAWASDGWLWQWRSCGHCKDYEENRKVLEEADERVRQAERSKQQFMAYVFHNIRVPFNAIVLGLGHMRALGDGGGMVGSGAEKMEKMDWVQMMLDCAETMTSVLDDVTDMGQWEGGQMELHKDEFDILAVIKFLSWGLKDILEQKEIAFNMNIDDLASKLLTSHRVIGDKQRVVQTLGNFLSNAVKFTPSGGKLDLDLQCEEVVESMNTESPVVNLIPSVTTSEGSLLGATTSQILSKTSSQMKGGVGKVARLRLSVKDNGIGISTEDQAKLFEPYSFVTSGWVLKAGVSGLGLSMARRFVEQAGGSIGVESEEGSGSTFFFSIPFPLVPVDVSVEREQVKPDGGGAVIKKSEVMQSTSSSGVTVVHESITLTRRRESMKEELKSLATVPDAADIDLKVLKKGKPKPGGFKKDSERRTDGCQRKVLLVEDTRINRIILRKVLLNLNLECDEAENGQIAVDLHKQGRRYDLVLMDKEMPVMDGHEATRQLRNMGVKTPIVALTGNALTTDKELFFEAGVDDFQTKPLTRERLVQLLTRYGVDNSCMKRT